MEPYHASRLVIRSACGDIPALERLLSVNDPSPLMQMSVLLALSHDIHPLATLIAFVRTENPPAWLRDRGCSAAPEALRLLLEPSHDSLRAEIGARSHYLRRMAESLTSSTSPSNETSAHWTNAHYRNAPDDFVGRLIASIGATRWASIPSSARTLLLSAVIRNPQTAAMTGGAVWGALNEAEQNAIALAAANVPSCAASLIASVGAGGWRAAPPAARKALMGAIARDPQAAATAGCAVWPSLDANEREIVARAAALKAECAASLGKGIGVEGWTVVSDNAKKVMLSAIMRDPWSMGTFCEAMWSALDEDVRATMIAIAAQRPLDAWTVMHAIGVQAWHDTPAAMRQPLIAAVARDPTTAKSAGTTMWTALSPDERIIIAQAMHGSPNGAAHLMDCIGAEEWNASPDEARSWLISALAQQPKTAWAGGIVWASLTPEERKMIALAAAAEPSAAANLLERAGLTGWESAPPEAQAALLAAIGREPESAARGGGVIWPVIQPEARAMIAYAVAIKPDCAANLLKRIGADGWRVAPAGAKAALLYAFTHAPHAAARGGGAIWSALDCDDMRRMVQCAAPAPDAVVDLLERIGAEGWSLAPPEARAAMLTSIAHSPELMIRGVNAVWTGMVARDLLALENDVAKNPSVACTLMRRCGPKWWRAIPESTRNVMISAVIGDPRTAAVGGGAVWTALALKHQQAIIGAVANEPFHAAHLMTCIGADTWRKTPDDARTALINAVASDPRAALHASGALWPALSPAERVNLAGAVAQSPSAAAEMMLMIGADAWQDAPAEARTRLLEAASDHDAPDVSALTAVWTALTTSERKALMQRAAQSPARLANMASRLGPDMWASLPPRMRREACKTLARDPFEAAKAAIAAWSALLPAERAIMMHSATRNPFAAQTLIEVVGPEAWTTLEPSWQDALLAAVGRAHASAARAFLAIGDCLDDERRIALACAALERPQASQEIARALHEGLHWREWMTFFVPSEEDADACWELWNAIIRRVPIQVAARLELKRRSIRRLRNDAPRRRRKDGRIGARMGPVHPTGTERRSGCGR